MLQGRWLDGLVASRRDFFLVFIPMFYSFAWFYMTLLMIERFLTTFKVPSTEASLIWLIYYSALLGSSIIGSIPSQIRRLRFLYSWMIMGTISSLLPALLGGTMTYAWSFMLGVSFGLGIPFCLAFFTDYSTVENRGRMSGIIFLATYLSAPFFAVAFSILDLTISFMILAIWRVAGLISFISLKPKDIVTTENAKPISFTNIVQDKTFALYLISWIMFILIDRIEEPVLLNYLRLPALGPAAIIVPIIGSFSAFFGGILSDRIGRKRVVIGGFVALGLAYAAIGIAPTMLISWYFYTTVDGAAWGILLATFTLTLWGDLSKPGARERYYVIGNTPLYFASIMQLLLAPFFVLIPSYATFSLASFFLFIAVLPLLYATETLPEKKMELRRLKGYLEQAKKIREKQGVKSGI